MTRLSLIKPCESGGDGDANTHLFCISTWLTSPPRPRPKHVQRSQSFHRACKEKENSRDLWMLTFVAWSVNGTNKFMRLVSGPHNGSIRNRRYTYVRWYLWDISAWQQRQRKTDVINNTVTPFLQRKWCMRSDHEHLIWKQKICFGCAFVIR